MMGVGAALGGEVKREWFEVMYGDNTDLAKAEYEKYKTRSAATGGMT